ncbi:ligand-binding sensor domain-containing protein [Algoriphagus formosus]|uniref:Hybrid sensor histidine kinase/response regulator n=1 Tax=Algoriphagus formosus TaxID=2007308 RepID=A0A4R5UVV8_9BACT|nr:two-component regulator propeller domain-containing protein [Algoriphagus aquimaris]TDK43393.1 hybrid sensor histidine kinase/response regulator [Algoriphagus aquimaris]
MKPKAYLFFIILSFSYFLGSSDNHAQSTNLWADSSSQKKNYVMEIWDNSNGLPQNAVFALEKDEFGYIWVSTEEGLVRLDGISSKVFDRESYPIMQEQTYFTFFNTKRGIWASGDRSIAFLNKSILKVIDCSSITENSSIRAVFEDTNGNLLIGNSKGEIYRFENEQFVPLEFWKPEVDLEIQSFFQLSPSELLVGTTNGLYKLNLENNTTAEIAPSSFSAMKVFGNSNLPYVFSPQEGIFKINQELQLEEIVPIDGIQDMIHFSLTLDEENRIWGSSSEKGLMIIDNGEVTRFYYPELNNYTVRGIIKDETNLYLGTLGKGLAIVKPAKVKQPKFDELQKKNIKALIQGNDSSIWVGTQSDGLFRVVGDEIQSWRQEDGLLTNGVTTLATKEGKAYIGSSAGVSILDIRSGKFTSYFTQENGLKNNYVQTVFKDSKNTIWILTRNGGLHYIVENGTIQEVDLPAEFKRTRFVSILESSNGDMIIGSMSKGMFRIRDGVFVENQPLPLTPGENIIYCIHEDKDGNLFFGTHGGLIMLRDGQFKSLKKQNGLQTQAVYSITDDGKNGYWITNNFGAQFFSYQEFNLFKESTDDSFFIGSTLYDQSVGMPNSEANGLIFPAVARDFKGRIWVPTVEGVGIIDPSLQSGMEKEEIDFQWDELQYGDKKETINEEITIPAGIRMFQVSFSLIDFKNPSQYSVFYLIESKSDNWLPLKDQRFLYFNGLKPGNYNLKVKILRYGQQEAIYSLPIRVSASFFETLFFKISLGLALILLIYLALNFYLSKKLKVQLEAKVSKRTLELSHTNEKLKEAVKEIEKQKEVLHELTWNQSHLLRAPLSKAIGINQLLLNYSKYQKVEKSKEELEQELLSSLKQVDEILKDTFTKSENLKKS